MESRGAAATPFLGGLDARDMLSSLPVPVGLASRDSILHANRKFQELFGYTEAELRSLGSVGLLAEKDEAELLERELFHAETADRELEFEVAARRKDGSTFDACFSAAILQLPPESRLFVFAVADITEQRSSLRALESRILALVEPDVEGDSESIRFQDLFDVAEIQEIQDAFAKAAGVASIITDTAGNPITQPSEFTCLCSRIIRETEKGVINCRRSDAVIGSLNTDGPIISPCLSGGLWDGGAGISVGDRHIANWLVGQVLDDSADLERIGAYADEIGADRAEFEAALAKVPRMSKERFQHVCRALFLVARELSALAYRNLLQARAILERRRAEETLRRSESKLREALAEKEALLRELHHRTKNNMSVVSSLLDMEADRCGDPGAKKAFAEMVNRISSMALAHEFLYRSSDLSWIDLGAYAAVIIDNLKSSYREANPDVSVSTDLLSVHVLIDVALPFGLLLNELVTNAFMHAFPDGRSGSIRVGLGKADDGALTLTVADDGVGLLPGIDLQGHEGMGMTVAFALAEQLNGRLSFLPSATGQGLSVSLSFRGGAFSVRV